MEEVKATVMFPTALKALEQVSHLGGRKHGYGSWKDSDNPSLQHKANHASVCRHTAEWFMGLKADPESGVDPRLHAAWRLLASYEREYGLTLDK